jgi:hypothetical protein
MKIFTCLAVVVLLFGCDQTPPPKAKGMPISVGMAYQDAEPILSGIGGMHVDMDNIQDTDTHILEVNKFPNGTFALIEISKESRKITSLKVCVDPNQPTEKLAWKSVKEFYPGID